MMRLSGLTAGQLVIGGGSRLRMAQTTAVVPQPNVWRPVAICTLTPHEKMSRAHPVPRASCSATCKDVPTVLQIIVSRCWPAAGDGVGV